MEPPCSSITLFLGKKEKSPEKLIILTWRERERERGKKTKNGEGITAISPLHSNVADTVGII